MIRPSAVNLLTPYNVDLYNKAVDVKWWPFIAGQGGAGSYDADLCTSLTGWTTSGTGTAAIDTTGAAWQENDSVLKLSCTDGQNVTAKGDAILSGGVSGNYNTFEFVIDTTNIGGAGCSCEIRFRCGQTRLRIRFKDQKLYVWRDALATPPAYNGWSEQYTLPADGIYKFRFCITATSTPTAVCMVYSNRYVASWGNLSMVPMSDVPTGCDNASTDTIGTVTVVLDSPGGAGTSDVLIDHFKAHSWGTSDTLEPWDGVLGEQTFVKHQVHSDTAAGFTPAPGTMRVDNVPWTPSTGVHVTGLAGGVTNYIKIVTIVNVGGTEYGSVSNEVEVMMPEQRMVELFASIRKTGLRAMNVFGRAVDWASAPMELFTRAVTGGKDPAELFASIREIGTRTLWLFTNTRVGASAGAWLMARAVVGHHEDSWLFTSLVRLKHMWLFTRTVSEGKESLFLFGHPSLGGKRKLWLFAQTKEDPGHAPIILASAIAWLSQNPWAQQLHGDQN